MNILEAQRILNSLKMRLEKAEPIEKKSIEADIESQERQIEWLQNDGIWHVKQKTS